MSQVIIKQGDSFHFPVAQFTQTINKSKKPLDITGMTFISEVRDKQGTPIAVCPITVLDALVGQISMPPVDTSAWPLKVLYWDIETLQNGVTLSTRTVELKIVRDVTGAS